MTALSLQQSTSVALKTAEGSTTDLATEIENIVKEKMVSARGSHRAWFPSSYYSACVTCLFVSPTNLSPAWSTHWHIVGVYSTYIIRAFCFVTWFLTSNSDYIHCLCWIFLSLWSQCMVLDEGLCFEFCFRIFMPILLLLVVSFFCCILSSCENWFLSYFYTAGWNYCKAAQRLSSLFLFFYQTKIDTHISLDYFLYYLLEAKWNVISSLFWCKTLK